MKIVLIGPGIMSIPPENWGGVESLMWDYKNELEKKNHSVTIINTKDLTEVISIANSTPADLNDATISFDVAAPKTRGSGTSFPKP